MTSDFLHYETVIPQWLSFFSSNFGILTEKKVEIFHSLLRRQCPSWSSGEQISEIAKVLSAKKFNSDFISNFLNPSKNHHSGQTFLTLLEKQPSFLSRRLRIFTETAANAICKKRIKRVSVSSLFSYGIYRFIPFQRLNQHSMNEHSPWASQVQYHHRSSTNAITTTAR